MGRQLLPQITEPASSGDVDGLSSTVSLHDKVEDAKEESLKLPLMLVQRNGKTPLKERRIRSS